MESGVSPEISILGLEKATGYRLVGNGSSVLRRDSHIFKLFNIEFIYQNKCLLSVKFSGYKDNLDITRKLSSDKGKLKSKIISLEESILDIEETLNLVREYNISYDISYLQDALKIV